MRGLKEDVTHLIEANPLLFWFIVFAQCVKNTTIRFFWEEKTFSFFPDFEKTVSSFLKEKRTPGTFFRIEFLKPDLFLLLGQICSRS